ncbi:Zinc finger CCHC domain-containing protein 3 [Holothuria leucospilota]|uniref:Zinc finger CCHC domain-containing protein 3 n=1 Tax=Holothuria leucospilota TaxID=206669 RepID=A0A9Q1BAI2_HOLLE|nr:Zinc finger CCHC domain-containing protein 3 [Holothuria leucospilota]
MLKNDGVEGKEIEMLQPLAARNTYDLKFRSDTARIQGVSCLKGLEGLTVTPYDRSVVVTVLYLNFDQGLVARVLSQYGTVSDMRWVTYQAGELKSILSGKKQFRMVLKREIPFFLFIGGSKAHIRYFGQPRTCFKCGEEGHEAKSCPNEVRCNLCGEEGHVSGSCPHFVLGLCQYGGGAGPEPMVEEPRSPSPDEVAHQVEQDFLASKQCEGTPEVGPPSSSSSTPREAGLLKVENDLQLSSDSETDSAMSDAGGLPQRLPQRIRHPGRAGLICVRG